MNIPNLLTVFRIILVPVFLVLMLKGLYLEAFIVFMVASFTDAIDGIIARRFNMETELGAMLDPIADKLLMVTSYSITAYLGWIPLYLAFIVILRDAIILLTVFVLRYILKKEVFIVPLVTSKANTFFQAITIVWALFLMGKDSQTLQVLVILTILSTFASGIEYGMREYKKQKEKR